jgi:hypothetical protein
MNPEPAWIFALLSRSNKTARRRGRSFVIGEQRVNVLERQGLRLRQRRIARKVARKNGLQIVAFLSDRSNTVPDPPFFRCVAPRRFRGNGGNDRSFELPGLANEVLVLTNKFGKPVVTSGKAHRQCIKGPRPKSGSCARHQAARGSTLAGTARPLATSSCANGKASA